MKKGKDFQWSHFWSNSSIFRNVNPTFTTVKVLINNRKLFQHTVLRSSFSFHSFHTSFYNNCVWLLNKVKCLKGHTCTSTHFTTPSIESRQLLGHWPSLYYWGCSFLWGSKVVLYDLSSHPHHPIGKTWSKNMKTSLSTYIIIFIIFSSSIIV